MQTQCVKSKVHAMIQLLELPLAVVTWSNPFLYVISLQSLLANFTTLLKNASSVSLWFAGICLCTYAWHFHTSLLQILLLCLVTLFCCINLFQLSFTCQTDGLTFDSGQWSQGVQVKSWAPPPPCGWYEVFVPTCWVWFSPNVVPCMVAKTFPLWFRLLNRSLVICPDAALQTYTLLSLERTGFPHGNPFK